MRDTQPGLFASSVISGLELHEGGNFRFPPQKMVSLKALIPSNHVPPSPLTHL